MFGYRYRTRSYAQFIIIFVVACIIFYRAYQDLINLLIVLALIGTVVFFIFKTFVSNYFYKRSIKLVSKQFVLRENALHNDYITVIYTPDEKIVVMDNFSDNKSIKRMFTLTKKQVNINKAWNKVCKIFDKFVTLESLVTFYSFDTSVDVIHLDTPKPKKPKKEIKISKSNEGPKFVELGEVQVDSFADGANVADTRGASFVEMGSFSQQQQYIPKFEVEQEFADLSNMKEQEAYIQKAEVAQEFTELGDILSSGSNKIDINFATASEIAILPGINIVGAKKIVEYRDLNGLFTSEEDFFKVANVKAHFVQKIRPMIIVGKPVEDSNDDDFLSGRIIDL